MASLPGFQAFLFISNFFQVLASFALCSIKCLLGCSSLCFQPCSGNKSLASFLPLNNNKEATIRHFFEAISLVDYWRWWGGCHLTPFLVEILDRCRSLSVVALARDRLEWTSLSLQCLGGWLDTNFGWNKTLPTFHIM